MERVFLDANVLVSAALKPESGIAGLWSLRGVRLLASPHVVAEARRNVREPAAAARLEQSIAALVVLPSEPADRPIEGDPDLPPKDRPVLLGAIVARSDVLLTGDLTHFGACLGVTYEGVMVLLPGEYLRTRS